MMKPEATPDRKMLLLEIIECIPQEYWRCLSKETHVELMEVKNEVS